MRTVPGTVDYQERRLRAFRRDIRLAVVALTNYLTDFTNEMSPAQPEDATAPPAGRKRLFISHASKDAPIVEELVDIIGLLGLTSEHIFYSSAAGYGIPLGENFYDHLKAELTADVLVLFMLSANFFASPVCLCEMGATWVLTNDHVPVLIPPFDFADVKGTIPATQGLRLTDKLKLNELAQKIARHFNLPGPQQQPDWERRRDKSLSRIAELIAQQPAGRAASRKKA